MKILANIICLNSAPELPKLLKSLEGHFDGLIAIDGGSTDDTVAVISNWGLATGTPVTVKTNPWPDDFALQRNICLDATREKYGVADAEDVWVLAIDSDDALVSFDRPYIEKAAAGCGIVGLQCRMDNGNGFYHVTQFFRVTANTCWCNPIHEFVETHGPKGLPPIGTLTIKRGRSKQHDRDPERNVRIGRTFVESNPNDSRGRFYLARDLTECEAIPLVRRLAEAEGHLRTYLAMPGVFLTQDRYALLLLVGVLCDGGRREEAKRLLLDSLANDPDNKSAYEALSRLSDDKQVGVWHRLSAAAEGTCVLPYSSKLPAKLESTPALT